MKFLIECFVNIESAPQFSYGLARGLKNNGVDVYAIVYDQIENIDKWLELLGHDHLIIINFPFSLKTNTFNSLSDIFMLIKRFKGERFDYLLDTFPMGIPKNITKCLNIKHRMCIDHDVIHHSSTPTIARNQTEKKFLYFNEIVILSRLFNMVAAKKHPNKPIHVLHHGAMEYPVLSSEKFYNNQFDINFLYFGRIDGYKGLHVLAKAYSYLVEEHENISLTVAGGGDFSEYDVEYAVLPNCTVVNKYLTDNDIAFYFGKPKTVVVLPYLDATQSGVIGMAFNYRTPVIVSDTGGLKEQLFDGEMGIFVEPGNAKDLEEKMEKFIINKELYKEQKKKMDIGYKKSTWDYVTKEFLAHLKGNI